MKKKNDNRKSFKNAALDVVRGALGSTLKTLRLIMIIIASAIAWAIYKNGPAIIEALQKVSR